MTSEEAFNFYWVIPGCSWNIFSAKHADDSIKDSEVENRLEKKIDFADLVKDAKSVATVSGFSPCPKFRVGPNDVT